MSKSLRGKRGIYIYIYIYLYLHIHVGISLSLSIYIYIYNIHAAATAGRGVRRGRDEPQQPVDDEPGEDSLSTTGSLCVLCDLDVFVMLSVLICFVYVSSYCCLLCLMYLFLPVDDEPREDSLSTGGC